MSDERIERALRAGPPHEPAYAPGIRDAIGPDRAATEDAGFAGRVGRGHTRTGARPGIRALRLAGPIAAALVVALVAVSIRLALPPGAPVTASPGDLLERIRASGTVRIAITSGPPQTTAAGGAVIGFDVDVARAVAEGIRARDSITVLPTAEILGGSGTWDLGFPSRVRSSVTVHLTTSEPYYGWPAWLVVADSGAAGVEDLAGARVCAVADTAGADWLAGRATAGVVIAEPAPDVEAVERATDAACFDAIAAGDADAAVTGALLDDELQSRGMRTLLDDPVLVEQRSIVVRGSAADIATLIDELDRIIADLRATGRLAELSRASFGGRDLTGIDR